MSPDPLAHLRILAAADPAKWGPALAEHERQMVEGPRSQAAPPKLPPLWRRALNFARAALVHLRAGLPRTPTRLARQRWKTCKACPKFIAEASQCGACGCYLRTKISWELSTCPEKRW